MFLKCTCEHNFPLLLLSISSSPLYINDSSLDTISSFDTDSSFDTNSSLDTNSSTASPLISPTSTTTMPSTRSNPDSLTRGEVHHFCFPDDANISKAPPRNKYSAFLNCSRRFCSTYRTLHDSRRPIAIRYHASRLSCLSCNESIRRSKPRSCGARC